MAFDFAREWPFFPDDEKLRIFEPRANVAILIGHTATDVGGATKVDAPLALLLERLPAAFPTRPPSLRRTRNSYQRRFLPIVSRAFSSQRESVSVPRT